MTGSVVHASRPRLAVLFDHAAVSPLQLREALGDHCELIWVVDASLSEAPSVRLLERLGTVVDITGMGTDEVVTAVRAAAPDGVVGFSDRRIHLAALLADRLGLVGLSPASAATVVDKFHQRAAFAAAGLPGPRSWRVGAADADAVAAALTGARFPVIVKPEIGEGSRHVEAAADVERLRELLAAADRSGRDSVVEEFIEGDPDFHPELGDYLSVESVVSGSVTSHLALTGRLPVAEPFRETGFFMPAAIDDELRSQVLDLATAAIAALGIEAGCLHTEIKLTPTGPQVIEVNARLGGGMADLLSLVSDVDLFEIAARVALGESVVFERPVPNTGIAYLFYAQAPKTAQRVFDIAGLDELGRAEGVVGLTLNRPPGSLLDWRDGNHGYVYSVLGSTTGLDEMLAFSRTVGETVVVTYEQPHETDAAAAARPVRERWLEVARRRAAPKSPSVPPASLVWVFGLVSPWIPSIADVVLSA